MKKYFILFVVIIAFFQNISSSAQESGQNPTDSKTIFGTYTLLFLSLETWPQMKEDNKIGFGFSGENYLGAKGVTINKGTEKRDWFLGVGLYIGYNILINNYTISGYSATSTWGVFDAGFQGIADYGGGYFSFGGGYSRVGLDVSMGGHSQSSTVPDDASFYRFGFGYGDFFLFGFAITEYVGWADKLSRIDMGVGLAF